jgi:hypothetical protein
VRRRHLPPSVAALTLVTAVPLLVVMPPLAGSAPAPHPVAGVSVTVPLSGVDRVALRQDAASSPPAVVPPSGTWFGRSSAHSTPSTGTPSAGTPSTGAGPVPAVPLAPPADPVVLTAQRSTARFDLVALTWDGTTPVGTTIQVRVREQGSWTAWQQLEAEADGPDATSAEGRRSATTQRASRTTHASAPLLTGGADGVQVRIDSATGIAPSGVKLQLVDGGRSDADAPTAALDSAAAATREPAVVTRSRWGADESLVKAAPEISDSVQVLFVHHTDTTNSYGWAEAYAQVRSVYVFHTKVRGWNDIGYNFLVDRYGRVFEGRRGSLTQPVVGAHAGGFNVNSLGFAALGSYQSVTPPPALVAGLTDVLAWQAAQYGVNPTGTSVMVSAGGSYTAYPQGTRVKLPTVAGHRNADLTDCPGNDLYPALPGIRTEIARRMVPALTGAVLSPAVSRWPSGTTFTAVTGTTQTWTADVTGWCGTATRWHSEGRIDGRFATAWPGSTAGSPVAPGLYRVAVTTRSPVGSLAWVRVAEVLPSPGSPPSPCRVTRLAVADAASASVAAGRALYPSSRSVVLVTGQGSDALAAAALARAKQAPLLVTGTTLPAVVSNDLADHAVNRAWVIGGVPVAVENQLKARGITTVRLKGVDRYATAAAIAAAMGSPQHAVVLARLDVAPSLQVAAAAAAASAGRPLLFLGPQGLPTATSRALTSLGIRSAALVTRSGDLPAGTTTALRALKVTSRWSIQSSDEVSTARTLAAAWRYAAASHDVTVLGTGAGNPWGVLAAERGAVVLLNGPAALSAPNAAWVRSIRSGLRVVMAGDGGSLSQEVSVDLAAALR